MEVSRSCEANVVLYPSLADLGSEFRPLLLLMRVCAVAHACAIILSGWSHTHQSVGKARYVCLAMCLRRDGEEVVEWRVPGEGGGSWGPASPTPACVCARTLCAPVHPRRPL